MPLAPHDPPGLVPEALPALVHRLHDPAERRLSGLYTIERHGALVMAVDAGLVIEGLVTSAPILGSGVAQILVRRLKRAGVPAAELPPDAFRALHRGTRASGVIALLRQRWIGLHAAKPDGVWLAADRIRSPGNLGTLLRTVDAVGGRGLIVVGEELDPYDPAVVQSAMTGVLDLRFVRTNWASLRRWASDKGVSLVAASPTARTAWDRYTYPPRMVLWLGEERRGVSEGVARACDARVRIPIVGRADSLNVATAGAIVLYEAFRQRRAAQVQGSGEDAAGPAGPAPG